MFQISTVFHFEVTSKKQNQSFQILVLSKNSRFP